MGRGGVLMRRLENVRGEFSLTVLAYNIRRATTLAGIPELIAAGRPGAPRGALKPAGIALPRACCNASGRMASANRHNPITAQIGLSHRKIRLGPTFHAVSCGSATLRPRAPRIRVFPAGAHQGGESLQNLSIHPFHVRVRSAQRPV